jgi:hypothetical protein
MVTLGLLQRVTQEFLAGMIPHEAVIISLRYGLFDGRAWTLGGYGMRPLAGEREKGHPELFMTAARHRGRLLRAEPVAQRIVQDKVPTARRTTSSTSWSHWLATDPESPGRIDASCIRVYASSRTPTKALSSMPRCRPRRSRASSGGAAGLAEPSRPTAAGLASELLRPPPGCAAPRRRYLPVVEALLCASSFEWDETAAGWAAMPAG